MNAQSSHELSASYAWLYRWGIPGLLTILAILAIWYFAIRQSGLPDTLSVAIGIAIAGSLMCIARIFDRAKRVWVDGQNLIINDYSKETEVSMARIESAKLTPLFWPHRITIKFSEPTAFGDKISFFPVLRSPWSSEHQNMVNELSNTR
ncbi:MAG: hypothetical protein OEU86_09565 [Gammaproteobacteria bacterium]|nr:hypothetical protein [Gammaproteobacteria bacterium]